MVEDENSRIEFRMPTGRYTSRACFLFVLLASSRKIVDGPEQKLLPAAARVEWRVEENFQNRHPYPTPNT